MASASRGVGHQGDVARAFDRGRHRALVQSAVAADATRHDLAAIADEVLQLVGIFVVDDQLGVGAEAADLALAGAAPQPERIVLAAHAAATTTTPVFAAVVVFVR